MRTIFFAALILNATVGAAQKPSSDPFNAALALLQSSSPADRHRGADALGAFRRPESARALIELLGKDGDARVRQTAATSLGLLADLSAAPALIGALNDGAVSVQLAAVRALGVLRAPSAVAPLTPMLKSSDPMVRRACVLSLGQIAPGAVEQTLRASLNDPDRHVRLEAGRALAQINDESLSKDFDEAIGREKDPETKAALVAARLHHRERRDVHKKTAPKGAAPRE